MALTNNKNMIVVDTTTNRITVSPYDSQMYIDQESGAIFSGRNTGGTGPADYVDGGVALRLPPALHSHEFTKGN